MTPPRRGREKAVQGEREREKKRVDRVQSRGDGTNEGEERHTEGVTEGKTQKEKGDIYKRERERDCRSDS